MNEHTHRKNNIFIRENTMIMDNARAVRPGTPEARALFTSYAGARHLTPLCLSLVLPVRLESLEVRVPPPRMGPHPDATARPLPGSALSRPFSLHPSASADALGPVPPRHRLAASPPNAASPPPPPSGPRRRRSLPQPGSIPIHCDCADTQRHEVSGASKGTGRKGGAGQRAGAHLRASPLTPCSGRLRAHG